jgi:hypothetical protein
MTCSPARTCRQRIVLSLSVVAFVAIGVPTVRAATKFWKNSVTSGSWSVSNDWSAVSAGGSDNGGVPAYGDVVNIVNTDGTGRLINLDVNSATLAWLTIDLNGAGTSTETLNIYANSLYVNGSEIIGDTGRGDIYQTGSSHNANDLTLGGSASGFGTYTMNAATSSPTLFVGSSESIGSNATGNGNQAGGTFNQSAGTHTVGGNLTLAVNSGSTGAFNLSGGSLIASSQIVGKNGAGTFNQSAGANSVNYSLTIAANSGSTGAFNLSGGTLTVGYQMSVGSSGTGTFVQSGGSVTTGATGGNTLFVGLGSNGTYTMNNANGTATLLANGGEIVGYQGTGIFNQLAGTHTVKIALDIGFTQNIIGVYDIFGGTLNADNITVGGDAGAGPGGTGILTIGTGATVTVAGNVKIWNTASTLVTLSGGSLTTAGMDNTNNPALFKWTAGTLTQSAGAFLVTSLTVPVSGTYNFNGGTFTGQFINNGITNLGADFTASAGVTNNGSMTLAGGALSGPIVNNNLITGHGTIASASGITNNGVLQAAGGPIVIAATGNNVNFGNIITSLANGLQLTGSGLTNQGSIALSNSTISGSATLTNSAGGSVGGPGLITTPFTNAAGAVLSNGGPGTLTVASAFTNVGLIQLAAFNASLSGGAIANIGTIQGLGNVGNTITNSGTIEAIGGTLVFTGSVTNSASGTIRSSTGTKVLMQGSGNFAANEGSIDLTGGTLECTAPLTNAAGGFISGRGTLHGNSANFYTGSVLNPVLDYGLKNYGVVEFSGGFSDVFGKVNNLGGSKVIVSGGSTATFYNAVTCNAGSEFRVSTASTAVFFGNVTGTSTFTGSGTKDFEGGSSSLAGSIATLGDTIVESSAHLTVDAIRENSLSVVGSVTIRPNGSSAGTSVVSALAINGGGKLDLNDNNLIVHNGNLVTLAAQLKSGLNASGTLWTGPGIQSSTAAADAAAHSNATVFAVGAIRNIDKNGALIYSTWPASPSPDFGASGLTTTDVLVKYTYFGDADLNGVVDNTTDYDLWSNGFTDSVLAATNGWLYGDFDFSGIVDNTTDYDLWSTGFAHQGGALSTPAATGGTGVGTSGSLTPATDVQGVPEPAALVLTTLAATMLALGIRHRMVVWLVSLC